MIQTKQTPKGQRVLLLTFSARAQIYFDQLARMLIEIGFEIKRIYQFDNNENAGAFHQATWTKFDFQQIDKFKPDRLIIFNGHAPNSIAATATLAQRYQTLFCEMGWFPQAENLYIDPEGLGGKSALSKINFADLPLYYAESTAVTGKRKKPFEIFAPLQLDHDTAIINQSPYIKTMESFIDFVLHAFGADRVIFKPHPSNKKLVAFPRSANVASVDSSVADIINLSERVVGINSTVLLESVSRGVPTAALGMTILDRSNVFFPCNQMLKSPAKFLRYRPYPGHGISAAKQLKRVQFSWRCPPPEWIINLIMTPHLETIMKYLRMNR